jgi:hypothetical protein
VPRKGIRKNLIAAIIKTSVLENQRRGENIWCKGKRATANIYIFYFQFNFDALISQKNWTLSPDGFYHFASEIPKAKEPIPSVELAEQTIFYARELEMIV